MAFTPATLSIIAQPVSGRGLRFWSYVHDDTIATITGAGYFTNAARYGLQIGDLIFVAPDAGAVDTYILSLTSIDTDGHGTAVAEDAGVWTDSNDGAGSGLDADLLDGQEGSFYTTAANINHTPGWTGSGSSTLDKDAEIVLRPHKFLAVGDGVTDDTAALNLALAFLKAGTTSIRARKWFLDGGGKVYRVDGSLDATGITAHHNWGIRNIVLEAHCTGKVVLDLTDSRFGLFENVHIHGDATDTPYNGIQQARGTAGNAAGGHFFTNVTVVGDYTNAALHNYASEVCHYDKCKFWNEKAPVGGDEAWAAIFDGAGQKTAISDFATPATGTHAFNLTTLTSCEFRKLSVGGPTIFLSRYVGFNARGCYATSDDDAIITMFCDGISRDFEWHGHAEGTAPTSYIKFTGTAATRNVTSLKLIDHSPHIVDQIFAIDTLTGVNMDELDLRIDNYNAGSLNNGVFDDETKYKVRGSSIVVPSGMNTLSTFAEFTGMVRLTLDGTIKMAGAYQFYSDDAGATVGPTLDLFRDSASAAASDVLGRIRFQGNNSNGNLVTYTSQGPIIVAETAGAETGRHHFRSIISGTTAIRGYYEDGLVWGSPTGADAGAGTVNVENGYYNNNTPWLTGTGTPEGAVTAPVGSLFSRTDGGAATTLYVKESGTGNTGWAAK